MHLNQLRFFSSDCLCPSKATSNRRKCVKPSVCNEALYADYPALRPAQTILDR